MADQIIPFPPSAARDLPGLRRVGRHADPGMLTIEIELPKAALPALKRALDFAWRKRQPPTETQIIEAARSVPLGAIDSLWNITEMPLGRSEPLRLVAVTQGATDPDELAERLADAIGWPVEIFIGRQPPFSGRELHRRS